jgi:hypothetical protein
MDHRWRTADDRIDARTVGQARVDHRRRLVAAPTKRRDDPINNAAHMVFVSETGVGLVQLAVALDPDLIGTIDHNLADRIIGEQGFERTKPQQFGLRQADQAIAFTVGNNAPAPVEVFGHQIGDAAGIVFRLSPTARVGFVDQLRLHRFDQIALVAVIVVR